MPCVNVQARKRTVPVCFDGGRGQAKIRGDAVLRPTFEQSLADFFFTTGQLI